MSQTYRNHSPWGQCYYWKHSSWTRDVNDWLEDNLITVSEDRDIVGTNRLVASLLEEGILKRDSITVDDRVPVRLLIVTNIGAPKAEGRAFARNGGNRKVRMITLGRTSSRKHSVPEGTCTDVGIVSSVGTKALVVDTDGTYRLISDVPACNRRDPLCQSPIQIQKSIPKQHYR